MERLAVLMIGLGLAAALALRLCIGWLADDPVFGAAGGDAYGKPSLQPAGLHSSADWPRPAASTATSSVPMMALPSAPEAIAVPITVTARQKLVVGEMNDLVLGVGAHANVGEISFTVQFDADVLQVRAGMDGGWAAGAGLIARFEAEISSTEDRVQIRSAISGQPVGRVGGSVAIVQFQAVAPGTTSVMVTDVVIKDLKGKWIAPSVSAFNLQVSVDSAPPPLSEARHHRPVIAVAARTETTEAGD